MSSPEHTEEWVVIDTLPENAIVLIPEEPASVSSEVVATLEGGQQVLKLTAQIGEPGETVAARVFVDDDKQKKCPAITWLCSFIPGPGLG